MPSHIILASASSRRRKLLREMGFRFRVFETRARERLWPGVPARRIAERNALLKARAAARHTQGLIIAADTLVATRFGIVGKPRGRRDAMRTLSRLSGTRHRVITGLCVLDTRTGRKIVASEVTYVTMRQMTSAEIEAYVDSGEAMGKAGAYAIQETADRYVERIEGSFSNVVGLPVELLGKLLLRFGIKPGTAR